VPKAPEFHNFVLYIPRLAEYVTSSLTVYETAVPKNGRKWENFKSQKREQNGNFL